MGKLFVRWFVRLWVVSCVVAADGEWSESLHTTLRGKLVKKNFSAPRVIQNPPFGWFIELDHESREIVTNLFNNLSEKEREIYHSLDLHNIRLLTSYFCMREWARDHCECQVTVEGEILPPDLLGRELRAFNFIPDIVSPEVTQAERALACQYLDDHSWKEPNAYDFGEDDNETLELPDDEPERLVTVSGRLHLEIVNNDSELGEIENGGYPVYCWMVQLDPQSFEITCNTPVRACFQTPTSIQPQKNGNELWLTGDYDSEWLCEHVNQTVSVQGYLWHAHTIHHHTPVMLDTDPWFK